MNKIIYKNQDYIETGTPIEFENNCLKEDIKNMYCEEAILTILQDEFDLTRAEAQDILKEY